MTRREYEDHIRARTIRPGLFCQQVNTPFGAKLRGYGHAEWKHPWQVTCDCALLPDGTPQWRATIEPGFSLPGGDAYITMQPDWEGFDPGVSNEVSIKSSKDRVTSPTPVPLTNDPVPYLVIDGWRNPAVSTSLKATDSGDIIYDAAEGYPPYFQQLGVVPPSKGGENGDAAYDPSRTCQIRAADIVLTQPRMGTSLDYTSSLNLAVGQPIQTVQTLFSDANYAATAGRATLTAVGKFSPPQAASADTQTLFGLLLQGNDPEYEQWHIATVWMVSPPGADPASNPDQTWTPHPQHFVFWNIMWATAIAEDKTSAPAQLSIPLPPEDQLLIGSAVALSSEALSELSALLDMGSARASYWTL